MIVEYATTESFTKGFMLEAPRPHCHRDGATAAMAVTLRDLRGDTIFSVDLAPERG
jgi:hypothetical protein